MSTNNYLQINNESDLEQILQNKNRMFVLLYATWCPFCIRFLPIFKRCSEGKGQNFLLVQDNQEIMADKYSVEVVPTVLFFENGVVAKRLDGLLGVGLNEKQLSEFIEAYR